MCMSTIKRREKKQCDAHIPMFTRTLPNKSKETNNDICNNANPPTTFKQYLFEGNTTQIHTEIQFTRIHGVMPEGLTA